MLPTPSTSHVSFDTIYEPSEDSYLFLDTLSSPSESSWLTSRFGTSTSSPLVMEVGCGSGVVLGFVAANSRQIFGRSDILALGTDVNRNACLATRETVVKAVQERQQERQQEEASSTSTNSGALYVASLTGDLCAPLRPKSVDVLLFNPPYVPTPELPQLPSPEEGDAVTSSMSRSAKFESDSYLLSLTYAGGADGMETTNRLLDAIPDVLTERGVAYVLLCAQNRPEEVKERITREWACCDDCWKAETVGRSGMQAGWEKLVIVRIWRDSS